jgi:hypothetical protein
MKKIIHGPWTLQRIIRLILGGVILIQGLVRGEETFLLAGGVIGLMAILNIGCCGAGGCSIKPGGKLEIKSKEKLYEEVD